MKMQKKKVLIATIVAMTIFLSMFTALSFSWTISDPSSWYTTVNGNLNTDTYTQYPFEANSVSFGFSQYGELIGIAPGASQSVQTNWVGMLYDGMDAFCPKTTAIPPPQWINGWYLYISYVNPSEPVGSRDRNLWAFALFSDGYTAAGGWQVNVTGTPGNTGLHGGRQTNGMVITDPMQVLYNGPREYIAQATNHIYDNDGTNTWPVVDLMITMIFDKVSKQVVLYKDVKTTIQKLDLSGKLNVQLSDREEYDMGSTFSAYAHWYDENGTTCYTPSYSTVQQLTTDYIETQIGSSDIHEFPNGTTVYKLNPPNNYPVSPDYMKIYVGGVFVDPAAEPTPYTVLYNTAIPSPISATGTFVYFSSPPPASSTIEFKYKYVFKASCQSAFSERALAGVSIADPVKWTDQYDIAQIISGDNDFVAWDGFWPPCSSYTVDGIQTGYLSPLYDMHTSILTSAPKRSPLVIGQWDISMDPATMNMFRAVEVKGICNLHNAQDPQEPSGTPFYSAFGRLDVEAQYQLDSVFQPYNLQQSIDDNLNTWVDTYTVTATDVSNGYLNLVLLHTPVHFVSAWEAYDSESERVFVNAVLQYPDRSVAANEPKTPPPGTYHAPKYTLVVNNGVGTVEFPSSSFALSVGDMIKVIYATDVTNTTGALSYSYGPSWQYVTSGNYTNTIPFDFSGDIQSWTDSLSVYHDLSAKDAAGNFTSLASSMPVTNMTWAFNGSTLDWEVKPFTIYKEDTTNLEISDEHNGNWTLTAEGNGTLPTYNMTIDFSQLKIKWEIHGPTGDLFTDLSDVEITDWDMLVTYSLTVQFWSYPNGTHFYEYTGFLSFTPKRGTTLFDEEIPGSYNWGVVGANAASVDSAGLSLIAATLKDKFVEYGIAGEDINATDPTLQMPWIFSIVNPVSTGNIAGLAANWSPYLYNCGSDFRVGLKDDWDPFGTAVQITRANLVASGGPLANMLSYYGNDFATALYGIPYFTSPYGSPWDGAIVPVSCWNFSGTGETQRVYYTSEEYGYAVISTFEDPNGTMGLLMWGVWGRDTQYAAYWYYQDLAWEFQCFPCGATSIVLQITYNTTTLKPMAFNVVEVLGTISETGIMSNPWQPYAWTPTATPLKGGLHPDNPA